MSKRPRGRVTWRDELGKRSDLLKETAHKPEIKRNVVGGLPLFQATCSCGWAWSNQISHARAEGHINAHLGRHA